MSETSTEWISSRFRDRLNRKVEARAAELEAQGWSVSWRYAGELDGKHQGQLILSRGVVPARRGR